MRERVEFPVSLDLPPPVRESVRFKNQKNNNDDADGHLPQKRDVVLQAERLIDWAVTQRDAEPFHRFRQQYHEGCAHQRTHDRTDRKSTRLNSSHSQISY